MAPCSSNTAEEAMTIASEEKVMPAQSGSSVCQSTHGICKDVVHQDVCVSAKVVIDPIVNIGPICTHCAAKPEIIPCTYGEKYPCGGKCCFIVRQRLCVEVPIAFGTATTADPLGIDCKSANVGPCKCSR